MNPRGPRGGIGDVQTTCKLYVFKKCIEDSVRYLLKMEGAATATNATLEKQRQQCGNVDHLKRWY